MKLQEIDLHNKNVEEAIDSVRKNLNWMISNEKKGMIFIHGKGLHSSGVAVLKQEVRRFLENNSDLKNNGYIVVKGEEKYGITDTLNEGHVVVVMKGYENESSANGENQRKKAFIVHSDEGKEIRKQHKKNRKPRKRNKKVVFYEKPSPVSYDIQREFETPFAKKTTNSLITEQAYISDILTDKMEFRGVESIVVGIGFGYVDAIPAKTQFHFVDQLNYKIIDSLPEAAKQAELLNDDLNQLPAHYHIPSDSFIHFNIEDCQRGSIILSYKCEKNSLVRTVMLLEDPNIEPTDDVDEETHCLANISDI